MGLQSQVRIFSGEIAMFKKFHVYLKDDIMDRVQYRFPKTKKKRIVKKWKNRDCNYRYIPSKNLRIISLVGEGEVRALGHTDMKQHLEYLNTIAYETEGPQFIFVNERMEPI